MEIECPSTGYDSKNCPWKSRSGVVRDNPKVGILECTECHLVKHSEDLSEFVNYESGSMRNWESGCGYELHSQESDGPRRLKEIKELLSKFEIKSLLDFGCGMGEMLEIYSNIADVFGVEPDRAAREFVNKKGLNVFESGKSFLHKNPPVNVVTMFHVIEHLYNPSLVLQEVQEILAPGGILVVETPNSNDVLLSKYESTAFSEFTYWSHHPMLHSNSSLEKLLTRSGFEILLNTGVQRYSLNNHLYWLSKGKPGGHKAWANFVPLEIEENYSELLVSFEVSDTIWLVAQKPTT
jgi:2-polyprenyl-3-methyl-5-hydroxy-6-metoxy-1,4-benzoquinol methylase